MPAPHPRPTAMKIMEGNPGRRPLPENEATPDIPSAIPKPPKTLSKSAKKEWTAISEILYRIGLLTEIDTSALSLYCQAWGNYVDAQNMVNEEGMIQVDRFGKESPSPWINIAARNMELAHKFLSSFGMTPSSRAKAAVANKKAESKFSGLIDNGGFGVYGNKKQQQG